VPVGAPALPATLAAIGAPATLPEGWLRILAVTARYGLVVAARAWRWSLGPKEKLALTRSLARRRRTLAGAAPGGAPGGSPEAPRV
jgi:hypothetical protein